MESPTDVNQSLLRLLFNASSDGLVALDAGRIIDANGVAAEMLGEDDPLKLLGQELEEFSAGDQSETEPVEDSLGEEASEATVALRFVWRLQNPQGGKVTTCRVHMQSVEVEEKSIVLVRLQEIGNASDGVEYPNEEDKQHEAQDEGGTEESFLQLVLDTIPAAVFWKDRDLKFLGCNRQFAADAGFKRPSRVIGKTDQDMPWTSEDTEEYVSVDRRVIEANEPQLKIQERQLRADGTHAWVETNKVPMHNSQGEVIGIFGSYEDITERKLAELSLQEFSEGLHRMAETTADKSGQKFFDQCTKSLAEVLGFPLAIIATVKRERPGVLIPKAVWHHAEFVEYEEIDLADSPLMEAEMTKGFIYVASNVQGRHPNNEFLKEVKAAAWVCLPIIQACGDICGYFVAIDTKPVERTFDQLKLIVELIGGRVAVEMERCWAMEELERKIERANLLESVSRQIRASFEPDEIVQSTIVRLCLGLNLDRCLILSYHASPRPELIVSAEHVVEGIPNIDDREMTVEGDAFLEAILAEDTVFRCDDVFNEPLLLESADALRERQVKSMMAVRTSYQNQINGVLMLQQCSEKRVWTDDDEDLIKAVADQVGIALGQAKMLENERVQRHELARKNRALAKAKSEADAANHAKSEFLSRMSHELRTPLNAILGFSQVMARDSLATEQQRQHLATINQSGTHLLEMINDVLEMSRIEAGEVTVEPASFHLAEMLDSVVSMFQTRVHPEVKLKLGIAPDVPAYARTDEMKLRQILINLFGNAVKFTTSGEVALRVRAEQRNPDGVSSEWNLIAVIHDTGPGINEKELETLFQPFTQAESGRRLQQGTGLGLPISRQFARLLGGDISVQSRLGEGTAFSVTIPCEEANPAELDDQRLAQNQRARGLSPGEPSRKVLIVDDHLESRAWLEMLLESIGLQAESAENGLEALKVCEDVKPDVVFMDIHMPVMDGISAANELRQRYDDEVPLLVALTASAFIGGQDKIAADGPFDVMLPKPVHEKSLVEVFESKLGIAFDYGANGYASAEADAIETKPVPPKDDEPLRIELNEENETVLNDPVSNESCPILKMSEEWLERLEEAAARLNLNETIELLNELKRVDAASAGPLLKLCEDYQFDELQARIVQAREHHYATQ